MLKKIPTVSLPNYVVFSTLALLLGGCAMTGNGAFSSQSDTAPMKTVPSTSVEQSPEPPLPKAEESTPAQPAFVPPPPPTKPTYKALQYAAGDSELGSLPALEPGNKGKAVKNLQTLLAEAGFYRSPVDGIYAQQTQIAVRAVQKALDLPLKNRWRKNDWGKLLAYRGPDLPARSAEPNRVEVDLDRQLLYLIKADQIVAILPISSGNNQSYVDQYNKKVKAETPLGNYEIYRRLNGWREAYLGRMYRPWYFYQGYAVHGAQQVPPKPASHGCLRVTMWDADFLADELELGMPLHIWIDGGSIIEANQETETLLSKAE
ncbi:MAG: murein L,D-transpeptidase [Gammaproteobacteria bacterium]|nr:murein L,D-transpeptidase [Gammaproteobacteria bacterium]MCP5424641.1 murein L,D-transpeptidase [Gammaproteobacteria bacterium]MCP5460036.1 murein L,D-transpeptidase [Gammaproteobacteria bacterium]